MTINNTCKDIDYYDNKHIIKILTLLIIKLIMTIRREGEDLPQPGEAFGGKHILCHYNIILNTGEALGGKQILLRREANTVSNTCLAKPSEGSK